MILAGLESRQTSFRTASPPTLADLAMSKVRTIPIADRPNRSREEGAHARAPVLVSARPVAEGTHACQEFSRPRFLECHVGQSVENPAATANVWPESAVAYHPHPEVHDKLDSPSRCLAG